MTPPIRIGPKWSPWPSNEIEAILTARVAGWSDDQLRELVKRLVAERRHAAPEGIGGKQRAATAETPRA